jgi:hydrogenase maturation protein HypF
VSFDGTGYGTDGHIWGGEFLVADYKQFTRQAYLEYMPLPGSALAIKRPYRTAIGYLLASGIELKRELPFFKHIDEVERDAIKGQIEKSINTPLTSSMGRLFDAVAALSGVRGIIEYEAQAAIDLETYASQAYEETGSYPFSTVRQGDATNIKVRDLLEAIINDMRRKASQAIIAARFHNTVARMIVELCQSIATETGINEVALSGGVFQNRLLLAKAIALLESAGLRVYTHHQVPCNDGGISLGQAAIANFSED